MELQFEYETAVFPELLPESRKLAGSCCIMQYCFWSVCTGCFEKEKNRKNLFCVGNAGSGRNLSGSKRSDETPRGVSGDDAGCGTGRLFFLSGRKRKNYLIDGGSSSVDAAGRYRLEPFLKFRGVKRLDYVWVTHGECGVT